MMVEESSRQLRQIFIEIDNSAVARNYKEAVISCQGFRGNGLKPTLLGLEAALF